MVQYTGLRKNSKYSGENDKTLGVHGNMRGCVLEVNSDWRSNRQYICLQFY